jgi:hypothetical protein
LQVGLAESFQGACFFQGRAEVAGDGQQHRGVLARGDIDAALQVADRPLAHPRGLGQLVLGQPGLIAQPP